MKLFIFNEDISWQRRRKGLHGRRYEVPSQESAGCGCWHDFRTCKQNMRGHARQLSSGLRFGM